MAYVEVPFQDTCPLSTSKRHQVLISMTSQGQVIQDQARRSWALPREDSTHASPVPRPTLGSDPANTAPGRRSPRSRFYLSSAPRSTQAGQQRRCARVGGGGGAWRCARVGGGGGARRCPRLVGGGGVHAWAHTHPGRGAQHTSLCQLGWRPRTACDMAWAPQPHQEHPEPSRHGPPRPGRLRVRGGSRHTQTPARRDETRPHTDHFPLGFVVRSTQAK